MDFFSFFSFSEQNMTTILIDLSFDCYFSLWSESNSKKIFPILNIRAGSWIDSPFQMLLRSNLLYQNIVSVKSFVSENRLHFQSKDYTREHLLRKIVLCKHSSENA